MPEYEIIFALAEVATAVTDGRSSWGSVGHMEIDDLLYVAPVILL